MVKATANLTEPNPGIVQTELYKRMGHNNKYTLYNYITGLRLRGKIIRIPCIHQYRRTYRLYPRGQEPPTHFHEGPGKVSWATDANPVINKGHGDAFYTAFDEAFGILYIDLKILAGACGWRDKI